MSSRQGNLLLRGRYRLHIVLALLRAISIPGRRLRLLSSTEKPARGRHFFLCSHQGNLSLHELFRLYGSFRNLKLSTTFSIRPPVCLTQTVAAGESTTEKTPEGAFSLVLSPGIEPGS